MNSVRAFQLANLSYDGKILRAELGVHWKRMFEQLPLIGEALVMTRNQATILGRYMTFPELAFTPHGLKGASERGGLWFDFRTLGVARGASVLRIGTRFWDRICRSGSSLLRKRSPARREITNTASFNLVNGPLTTAASNPSHN